MLEYWNSVYLIDHNAFQRDTKKRNIPLFHCSIIPIGCGKYAIVHEHFEGAHNAAMGQNMRFC